MKWLIIFPIIILLQLCKMKSVNSNDLSKYSYFLYSKDDGLHQTKTGSGFFVKYKGLVYFLTNAHIVTSANKRPNPNGDYFADTFMIRMSTKAAIKYELDVSEIKNSRENFDFKKIPDLIIIPIKGAQNYEINYVDIEKTKPFDPTKISTTITYGFPGNKFKSVTSLDTVQATSLIGQNPNNQEAFELAPTFVIYRMNIPINTYGDGFSGSPTFLFYQNDATPYFGGVCFGGNEVNNLQFIIKPEVVIAELEKVSKR